MTETQHDLEAMGVHLCDPAGPVVTGEQSALDIMGEAFGQQAETIAVPLSRLSPDFFRLRSGIAGGFIQKFVNYHVRLAIVGDISAHVAASPALRDFVAESNSGNHVWFVKDIAKLAEKLTRPPPRRPAGS
jgi:hypothetical protein